MKQPDPLIAQLHELRTAAGMTVWQAEKQAELGSTTVSKWENGQYGPTVHGLRKLASVFGLRVELVPESEADRLRAEAVERLELELLPQRPSAAYSPITPEEALRNLQTLAEAIGDWPAEQQQVAS